MKTALRILGLLLIALSRCVAGTVPPWHVPPTPHGITTESGTEQAREDIAAGRLQLFEAGTRGVNAPNVPAHDARFAKLPRLRLPCGCTTPNAGLWYQYAKGYNAVVVEHVEKHPVR